MGRKTEAADRTVKDIRRQTRKRYSSEEKIRVVLAGLRGEDSIAELCRQEGIAQGMYYSWSKEFLEAGKKRLAGDTARAATSDEVKDLKRNNCHRQWETDPGGTSNLTHRSWCSPRSGWGDVDGGGTDGDYGFIEAWREHPRDCEGHGCVAQYGAALSA